MATFDNPLNNLKIASPCPANWDGMYGNEKVRFCGECKLNVYNLSGMTKTEAENLLHTTEGRLCVRYFRRADGTVLTQDCPVGWRAVKRKVSNLAAAACTLVLGLLSMIMLAVPNSTGGYEVGKMIPLTTPTPTPTPTPEPLMGDVVSRPSPTPVPLMGAIAPRYQKDLEASKKEPVRLNAEDELDDNETVRRAIRKFSLKKG